MEMWWFMSCKFKSLFKSNGLNFIYLFFWRGKERRLIRFTANINPPSTAYFYFTLGKGDLPLNSPIWTLRTETGLCLFFSSLENLYQAPNIYSLGSQMFQKSITSSLTCRKSCYYTRLCPMV